MGGETLPMTVAAACAGTLALESCAVVALARDQHSAARRLRRAVAVCAGACALVAAGLAVRSFQAPRRPATAGVWSAWTLALLLIAGWIVAALTLVELTRGVSLVLGGVQPLSLRSAGRPTRPLAGGGERASWLREPVTWRFGALVAAAVALAIVTRSSPAYAPTHPGGADAAGLAGQVALTLDVALAALAAVFLRVSRRRAASVVVFGATLSCLQLAYMLVGSRL